MKKFLALVLVALMAFGTTAAFAEDAASPVLVPEGYQMIEVPTDIISYDDEFVMTYIQEFANITQIPRPSYTTIKMTEYTLAWAAAHGFEAFSDDAGNVVIDVPATAGYENAPVVAVQGHIDMVPATDEGVEHDWLNDGLDLIWSENSLTADGTSLGADNGSGLAFMFAYMDYQDQFTHGPLRFVFTVDEEVGLLGAAALDASVFDGVPYLINVDGGGGGSTISSAGGKYFNFSAPAEWVEVPEGYVAYALAFDGLKGGHSAAVGGGKANGLIAMSDALLNLKAADIAFNLVSFEGGNAANAIPKNSEAVIVLAESDVEAATAALDAYAKLFKESYEAIEKEYTFTYGASDAAVEKALDADLTVRFLQVMSCIPNGIHTLQATVSGTESSCNLGVISIGEELLELTCLMRSSSYYQAEQMTLIAANVAELAGIDFVVPLDIATWPMKAENKLANIAAALYLEMYDAEYRMSATHGGLECGELSEKNPAMDIIATGISGGSAGHTTAEAMNFDKVAEHSDFLIKLIAKLAE